MRPFRRGAISTLACAAAALALLAFGPLASVSSAHRGHAHRHAHWSCRGAGLVPRPGDLARVRAATLCLINRERIRHHEAPLRLNLRLALAAQRHSESMVRGRYFAHAGPAGDSPLARIRATGYLRHKSYYAVGENIAWGTLWLATPRAIVASWMSSPGHRANILDPRFHETAVGVAPLSLRGRRRLQQGGAYTEDFGSLGGHGRSQRSS